MLDRRTIQPYGSHPGAAALGVVLLLIATSCQAPASGDAQASSTQADAAQPAAEPADPQPRQHTGRTAARSAVPPPPGVDAQQITPHDGEALQAARQPLADIVAGLDQPEYLNGAAPVEALGEPDIETQRHYVAARLALHQRDSAEAARQLRAAHQRSPERPELLQALAELYDRLGNKVRAADYLRQAVELAPNDTGTVFDLGRFAMARGEWDKAIALLHHVQRHNPGQTRDGRALLLICHYFLGSALERAGHDRAAVNQLMAYLNAPRVNGRSSGRARQLGFLQRQRGQTWQAVGDALHRLNQPGAALDAYLQARSAGVSDATALLARVLYTRVMLGDDRVAESLLLTRLSDADDREAVLPLVTYLAGAGIQTDRLARRARQLYLELDRPTDLALAIAALLPSDEAAELLIDHLKSKADASRAFAALLDTQLTRPLATDAVARAAELTAKAIDAAPRQAPDLSNSLRRAVDDDQLLLDALEQTAAKQPDHPAMQYLLGVGLIRAGDFEAAGEALRRAMQPGESDASATDSSQRPAVPAARLALARLAVLDRRFDDALTLLEEADDPDALEVVQLKVRVLSASEQTEQAVTLLDDLTQRLPENLDLAITRGRLLLDIGQVEQGQRALLDVLNTDPAREDVYEILFNLYDSEQAPDDAAQAYQRLMRRMLGEIPDSRIAHLKRAELFAIQRNYTAAETLLKKLLDDNDEDWRALGDYLNVLIRADRKDKADQLIQRRLNEDPKSRPLLSIAQAYYQRTGNLERLIEVAEQLIMLEPMGPDRAQRLAVLFLQTQRPQRAVQTIDQSLEELGDDIDPVGMLSIQWRALSELGRFDEIQRRVEQAVKRFPDHEPDLKYQWAMLNDRRGNHERAEQIMSAILKRFPKHGPANNGLGYAWADRGKNLDRAERMIRTALEDEPDSAAYLDSLGWVFYKQGNFQDAIVWLERSRAAEGGEYPVIIDHLGDAYYRAGNVAKARQAWRDAMQLMQRINNPGDRELEGLDEELRDKIKAVSNDQPAPVADVPGVADNAVPEAEGAEPPM